MNETKFVKIPVKSTGREYLVINVSHIVSVTSEDGGCSTSIKMDNGDVYTMNSMFTAFIRELGVVNNDPEWWYT